MYRTALLSRARITYYGRDERLFAEDIKGRPERETLHILLEGFVKVVRHTHSLQEQAQVMAYRQSGGSMRRGRGSEE